ncbi:MAG: DUF364 domain-containing protein [Caldilineales bacterium]|nr:DUF364 domain-containing protein [Caldilineales bacterium]MDW8317608.1 DUF364 domain-containing protein [Anaerolineae bacterium]
MADLIATLAEGRVEDLAVGQHWTGVVVQTERGCRCGLASTLRGDRDRPSLAAAEEAGRWIGRSGRELARLALRGREHLLERAIGMAAINALLPQDPATWTNDNAAAVIARHGASRRVALVGHFPFVDALRREVGTLWVLELEPRPGDLPAEAAAEVVPQADVLAMTGTTLINDTFDALMALRRPDALVVVLGPSTPLSPVLFDYGVDVVGGSVVEDVDAVLRALREGGGFRHLHRAGVRLVTMVRPGLT